MIHEADTDWLAPCVADPWAWDINDRPFIQISAKKLVQAAEAAERCTWCPNLTDCKTQADKHIEAGHTANRVIQAGQIYEPGHGWMNPKEWLRLAKVHGCRNCGRPTKVTLCHRCDHRAEQEVAE